MGPSSRSWFMPFRPRPPSFAIAATAVAGLAFALGCGRVLLQPTDFDGGVPLDGAGADANADAAGFELLGAPLIFTPTAHGFGLNVVLRRGAPSALRARMRDESETSWTVIGAPTSPVSDVVQGSVIGL